METRIKELIAVGASVTANCQPCLRYHVSQAREHGADEQDIIEAIAVAKMVRQGAMAKMDEFASTVARTAEAAVDEADKGCGCG